MRSPEKQWRIGVGIVLLAMLLGGVCSRAAAAEKGPARRYGTTQDGLLWEEPAPGLDYGRVYYYVPAGLNREDKPGLLVFMHGGGAETLSQPEKYLNPTNGWLRPHVDSAPFVVAAATAPHARGDHWRWCHADAEREIVAIIEQADRKFGIDRNRIVLGGQSMGGFGAYHLGPLLADRLAGVWAAAGGWYAIDFRALRGTPIFIQHGTFDCAPGYSNEPVPRAQYKTGVSFARAAHELLDRDGVDHVYSEYAGGHGLAWPEAQESTKRFLAWAAGLRRDPYAPAVTVVTPCGSEKPEFAVRRRMRWLEVSRAEPGTIELDAIDLSDYEPAYRWEDFEKQTYSLRKKRLAGFRLEAFNRGKNRFEVKAENVSAFRIYLARPMGDLSKPFSVDAGKLGVQELRARMIDGEPEYEAVLDFVGCTPPAVSAKAVVVRPKATDEVLDNPDMGIVWYAADGCFWKYAAATRPRETMEWFPGMNVIAFRLPWRELSVAGGLIRWDMLDSYANPWVSRGHRIALEITGPDIPKDIRAELVSRYAAKSHVAFLSIGAEKPRPDLYEPKICRETLLPRNWDRGRLMAELKAAHPRYFGLCGFPELCHRNNEELLLSVARRIGYRYELNEIRYPETVKIGEPFAVRAQWTNVGLTNSLASACVAYSLLDGSGKAVWTFSDEAADLRLLSSGESKTYETGCTFGCDLNLPQRGEDREADKMRDCFYVGEDGHVAGIDPGCYTLGVSVGSADGRPEIALPLQGGANRIYPIGPIRVQ